MVMMMPELVDNFRFSMTIAGKKVSLCSIEGIEGNVDRNGNMLVKPVRIENAHRKGEPTLLELLGSKSRKDAVIEEYDREGVAAVRILLKGCKLSGFKIGKHDAADNGPVLQSIVLHPTRVQVHTNRV